MNIVDVVIISFFSVYMAIQTLNSEFFYMNLVNLKILVHGT